MPEQPDFNRPITNRPASEQSLESQAGGPNADTRELSSKPFTEIQTNLGSSVLVHPPIAAEQTFEPASSVQLGQPLAGGEPGGGGLQPPLEEEPVGAPADERFFQPASSVPSGGRVSNEPRDGDSESAGQPGEGIFHGDVEVFESGSEKSLR